MDAEKNLEPDVPLIALPKQFYNSETGQPIAHCIMCNRFLLEDGVTYMIEKAIKQHHELNFSEPIFEYAMCMACATKMLIGMMIPTHEDRFFATMSQAFERMARDRSLYPIVVSTLRDPALEVQTVRTLISYQIEHLVITGATDPDGVSRVCRHHGVRHVNVDLPGKKAPSIISDNYWGAVQLTSALIARSRPQADPARDRMVFLGGTAGDYATEQRIKGFVDTVSAALGPVQPQQILACGYDVATAEAQMARLYARLGGLPRALFLASSVTLEGAIRFLETLPVEELRRCTFGSYDWDPFAAFLQFPVHMMKQNVEGLMTEAFKVIDGGGAATGKVVQVRPELVTRD